MGRIIPSVTGLLLVFVTSKAFDIEIAPANRIAAQIGDKLVLTCSTIDCETPSFSWRTQLDNPLGGTVNNKGNISILTMDPVGLANEHDYLCNAFCDNVEKEKNIKVDVYSFPSDPVLEISTPLNVGEKASVTCVVAKVYPSDRLEMQLEKDGSVLAREEFYMETSETTQTKSLTVTFIPIFEDIGKEITCVAELPIIEMEFEPKRRQTSQRLNVNLVPRITEFSIQPSTTVQEGDDVTIICSVESNPAARIVLRRKSDSEDTVLYSKDGIFHVPRVTFLNAGNYECEAENALGKSKMAAALSVEYGPRNTTVSVSPSATVREGEAVTMTCTSYGNPSPKISWTKHLISGESQFLSEDATLTINNIKTEDLGVYECEGANQLGREKKAVELIVQVPPKDTMLSVFPSDTVREGDSVTFSCTSKGIPAVQVILRKKTGGVDPVLVSENGRYTIYGAQQEDGGVYECESRNELGQQFQNIMLDVKAPSRNTTELIYPSDNVDEGEKVTITSTTYSNPPSQIVLQKVHPSNTTILSSQNGTASLYRVIRNYTGTFPVVVYNEAENNTEAIEIAVVASVKKPAYMIPVIVMVSCLSTVAIPVLAILIYVSRKAKINGSYHPVNALKPNV
ncbi:vascular cell adhesion protein 1 isoform X3 [Emydura macquarii macquarii]|uniref:vascular cell adhesion protein 1 isoform X3 n=1 Tax=Emydura macquarii macquarii TaxID=1129001 RepID=UPI00352A0D35